MEERPSPRNILDEFIDAIEELWKTSPAGEVSEEFREKARSILQITHDRVNEWHMSPKDVPESDAWELDMFKITAYYPLLMMMPTLGAVGAVKDPLSALEDYDRNLTSAILAAYNLGRGGEKLDSIFSDLDLSLDSE